MNNDNSDDNEPDAMQRLADTCPVYTDTDGDGLPDYIEELMDGYLPNNDNSDGSGPDDGDEDYDDDGISNVYEYSHVGTDPIVFDDHSNLDLDQDGLSNAVEYFLYQEYAYYDYSAYKYFANNADSDFDGILDGAEDIDQDGISNYWEIQLQTDLSGSDENSTQDADNDGVSDWYEIVHMGADPTYPDSHNVLDMDQDGISNLNEFYLYSLFISDENIYQDYEYYANIPDSDFDGILDGAEDPDGDGISNAWEEQLNTTPFQWNNDNNDFDMDGINDLYEILHVGTDPTSMDLHNELDTDQDGISNLNEFYLYSLFISDENIYQDYKYFANIPDSDFDGILDGAEDPDGDGISNAWEEQLNTTPSQWNNDTNDFDMDGVNDLYEILHVGTDPTSVDLHNELDTDQDGISNLNEFYLYSLFISDENIYQDYKYFANIPDSDFDGILDGAEDPDGDGISNAWEEQLNTTPSQWNNDNNDFDMDGINDLYEILHVGTDPTSMDLHNELDMDQDGISNLNEFYLYSLFISDENIYQDYEYYANIPDSDFDGILDGAEDPDGDGFSNAWEEQLNTTPSQWNNDNNDFDMDGVNDLYEILHVGTDPTSVDLHNELDMDQDGISNLNEFYLYSLFISDENIYQDYEYYANIPDSDFDGILDGAEDPDGDGISNAWEEQLNTTPSQWNNDTNDFDMDGVNDLYEILHVGTDPTSVDLHNELDMDQDGISNLNEFYLYSLFISDENIYQDYEYYANIPDSDFDGILDGAEDPDGDGFSNAWEEQLNTTPSQWNNDNNDFDMDGVNDLYEILHVGTDPTSVDLHNELDMDQEGISNLNEFYLYSLFISDENIYQDYEYYANIPDSDFDGILDGAEDPDGDGISNAWEEQLNTTPSQWNNDTNDFDMDGVNDLYEILHVGTDPTSVDLHNELDMDQDGISNLNEFYLYSLFISDENIYQDYEYYANIPDSDFDGILDGAEDPDGDGISNAWEEQLNTTPSQWNNDTNDFDMDGVNDLYEILHVGTDPTSVDLHNELDTDQDGLSNAMEYSLHQLYDSLDDTTSQYIYHANIPDSDFDGILDGAEDPDGDGISNAWEEQLNTTPFQWNNDNNDFDMDGINDLYEILHVGTDPTSMDLHNELDTDQDGLSNAMEYSLHQLYDSLDDTTSQYIYHANIPDSDFDGILDGAEDLDGDGIGNAWEEQLNTTPSQWNNDNNDFDMDGINDLYEILYVDTDPTSMDLHNELDTDQDGLSNAMEYSLYLLYDPTDDATFKYIYHANNADSDHDGIPDGDEDLDQDGISNALELQLGRNHLQGGDTDEDGTDHDYDQDGLSDYYEIYYANTDPASMDDHKFLDMDLDGLNNLTEYSLYLSYVASDDPNDIAFRYFANTKDSDFDGVDDGFEDVDADGLPNAVEQSLTELIYLLGGTVAHYYPDDADSDDNGTIDGDEDYDNDGYSNHFELDMGMNILVPDEGIAGCTDAYAANYNGDATINDGSCTCPVNNSNSYYMGYKDGIEQADVPGSGDMGDLNCDGEYNVLDIISLVNHVINGGDALSCPEDDGFLT